MKDGSTAFDWAVYGGDIATMAFLAQDPRVDIHSLSVPLSFQNRPGRAALHGMLFRLLLVCCLRRAMSWSGVACADELRRCVGRNNFGCGAAFWAAAAGRPATCEWLFAQGVSFHLVNQAGHTSVHKVAAPWMHRHCTMRLVSKRTSTGPGFFHVVWVAVHGVRSHGFRCVSSSVSGHETDGTRVCVCVCLAHVAGCVEGASRGAGVDAAH